MENASPTGAAMNADAKPAETNRRLTTRPAETRRWPVPSPPRPALRFSPAAWVKLLYLRDRGRTEVGGFGLSPADDLLYVEDVRLVRQHTSVVSVRFKDAAVADYFDEQTAAGRRPEQFARVWIHTHPGGCPRPSGTEEETFARVFGRSDWAVMFILAAGGPRYARLQFRAGVGRVLRLPVRVDWRRPFAAADHAACERKYHECVRPEPVASPWDDLFPFGDERLGRASDEGAARLFGKRSARMSVAGTGRRHRPLRYREKIASTEAKHQNPSADPAPEPAEPPIREEPDA